MTPASERHARARFIAAPVPPPLDASARAFVGASMPHGIGEAVLIQPSFLGSDTRYLLAALRRDRAARAAVAVLDPTATRPQAQVERLHRLGVRGMRLVPLVAPELDWFGPAADGAGEAMAELGMIASVLAGSAQLGRVGKWAARHEHLTVVIDHLGRPDTHAGGRRGALTPLLRLAAHTNVFAKMSGLSALSSRAFPHTDTGAWARRAVEEFGSERTLWGSDYPWTQREPAGYAGALGAALLALGDIASDALGDCFAGTARRLYCTGDRGPTTA